MEYNILKNEYRPVPPEPADPVLIFKNGRVLTAAGEAKLRFPTVAETGQEDLQYLFRVEDEHYFLKLTEEDPCVPEGYEWSGLRQARARRPLDRSYALMTGSHLSAWYTGHRYCGACGAKLRHADNERRLDCPVCGHSIYPNIKPAVIVALVHDGKLLMTTDHVHDYKHYALVAGFCEIGESAEDTVRREVLEEVGLHASDLRFYGTQPWGYAANLMIGYFAHVEGDATPVVDPQELDTAVWLGPEEIEEQTIPSIGSEMIMQFKLHGDWQPGDPHVDFFRF